MSENLPYAEDAPSYWKTGKSSPDQIIEEAKRAIESFGGEIIGDMYGSDENGRAGFVLIFRHGEERYRVTWPVLTPKDDTPQNRIAAKRQAATYLKHYCKAQASAAAIIGVRNVFLSSMLLPTGQTVGRLTGPEMIDAIPDCIAGDDTETIRMIEYREGEAS